MCDHLHTPFSNSCPWVHPALVHAANNASRSKRVFSISRHIRSNNSFSIFLWRYHVLANSLFASSFFASLNFFRLASISTQVSSKQSQKSPSLQIQLFVPSEKYFPFFVSLHSFDLYDSWQSCVSRSHTLPFVQNSLHYSISSFQCLFSGQRQRWSDSIQWRPPTERHVCDSSVH